MPMYPGGVYPKIATAAAKSSRFKLPRAARFALGAGAVGAAYGIGMSSGVRGLSGGSSGATGMPPASSSGGMM